MSWFSQGLRAVGNLLKAQVVPAIHAGVDEVIHKAIDSAVDAVEASLPDPVALAVEVKASEAYQSAVEHLPQESQHGIAAALPGVIEAVENLLRQKLEQAAEKATAAL